MGNGNDWPVENIMGNREKWQGNQENIGEFDNLSFVAYLRLPFNRLFRIPPFLPNPLSYQCISTVLQAVKYTELTTPRT